MTFLNPALLFGILAAALPVVIHLLTKPRLRQIKWAANRFLVKCLQKNRSRSRIEDVLLLLLRCLIVALLAVLFARPALLVSALGLSLAPEPTTAVIVVDDTASMGQSDGTRTRFDQAKSMVDDLLSKMASGSTSALYLVSNRTKALIPKPTEDFAILRRTLDRVGLTDEGGDLYPGIQAAVDLLKTYPGRHRDIYVLTDSQKAAWTELGRIRQLQDENRKEMTMHFLTVGDGGEDNLAVSDLQMAGTVAVINQPLRYTAQVSNWGKGEATNISVKLAVDSEAPQSEGMIDRIQPGDSKVVNLFARFREPGTHTVTVSIPGDRLPSDNQRSMALVVLEEVHTLVVEGTSNEDPTAQDGFFLSHALAPVRPDQKEKYYVKIRMGHPNDLESSTLNQYELIFLSNVPQLTPRSSQDLAQYVKQGGTLVIFPGPATNADFYNSDPTFGPLLPAKLASVRDVPVDQKALTWQSKAYEHPITALWNDPQSGNLGSVRTTRYFPLTVAGPPAQVVLKYANGEVAAADQSVGKGRVILFSSTATTAWNTFPLHPSFVPFLSRIIAYATSGLSGNLNLAAGQPFTWNIDLANEGKDLSVLGPGDKERHTIGVAAGGEQSAILRDSGTDRAGAYQVFVGDAVKPAVVFAVQGDPAESNLVQEAKTDLDPLVSNQPSGGPEIPVPSENASRLVPGRELWYPLVLALLILGVVETALAHRFSQSK